MEVSIVSYRERGMEVPKWAGLVGDNNHFKYLSRDGLFLDRPFAGDLFDT